MSSIDPIATPHDLMAVLWRHKWKSALVFLVGVGVSVAFAYLWPPTYNSEAKLFVRLGRESVSLDPTATTGQTIALSENRELEINSIMEVLNSRALLEQVVDKLGPAKILGEEGTDDPMSRELAVIKLDEDSWVDAAKRSSVLTVHAEANSPELAREIVQTMSDLYLESHGRLNRTAGSHDFFVEQHAAAEKSLQELTEQLRDAKNEAGLLTIDGQRQTLQQEIGSIQSQILTTESALAAGRAKLADLKSKVEDMPERVLDDEVTGLPNEAGDGMKTRFYELQIRERELAAKFTDDHPQLITTREQLSDAKRLMEAEPEERTTSTGRINRLRENLEFSLRSEEAAVSGLAKQLAELKNQKQQAHEQLLQGNRDELRVAQLQREANIAESKFKTYAEKLEQTRIEQALTADRISNVNVVQQPTYVLKPIFPQKKIVVIVGALASLVLAVATAFLAEYFYPKVRTPEQVERQLELPVLASIPRLSERHVLMN